MGKPTAKGYNIYRCCTCVHFTRCEQTLPSGTKRAGICEANPKKPESVYYSGAEPLMMAPPCEDYKMDKEGKRK